jgi:flagellar biogenesis protein FliO
MIQNFYFCFEKFCKHKYLIFNCFALLFFSIVISTILAMVLSAALLAKYVNIRKHICYPIQILNQVRMLSNGENISVILIEKKI